MLPQSPANLGADMPTISSPGPHTPGIEGQEEAHEMGWGDSKQQAAGRRGGQRSPWEDEGHLGRSHFLFLAGHSALCLGSQDQTGLQLFFLFLLQNYILFGK